MSHETLYQHVYADKCAGGKFWQNLRCHKKRRKRCASGRERRGQIIGRLPLSERPVYIQERKHVGHWEGDTVIGANHKGAIVTLVERKSWYAVLAKAANKTAGMVSAAIVNKLQPIAIKVNTLTYDDGKEFAEHAAIDKQLGSTAYFARPYASWERGTNADLGFCQNFNGLLSQYVPMKRHMDTVTDEEIRMIQDRLNTRPPKRLGFRTPSEVFHEYVSSLDLICRRP